MNPNLPRLLLLASLVFAAAILGATLLSNATAAAQEQGGAWGALDPNASGFAVVRAYYRDPSQVSELAQYAEPWEVHSNQGYVVIGATDTEIEILKNIGFVRIEVDEALTAELTAPRAPSLGGGIPGFPCYRTVEETYHTAADLAANYPNLAAWIDVGDSWEKTQNASNGYDMMVLVLTNQSTPGPKPKLFLTGALHAREYATAETLTRFAEHLIANYGVDPDITWLLDSHEIHLMLHANPDGRKHAEAGVLWRKNTNSLFCGNPNAYGIDLNRNFEFQWGCCGGSSGSPCSDTYRGPSAGSEPETQAITNWARAIFPDQRGPSLTDPAPMDATGVYIDVHSYGGLIMWPWGFTNNVPPNGAGMQTLGRRWGWYNGYTPQQAIELYVTDGATKDFSYGDLGVPGYTIEIGTSFFQSCTTFENTVYPANLPVLLYAAKVARTPYITPSGPDTLNITVNLGSVPPGTMVTLSGTVDDTRFQNNNGTEATQNITAAEYYVDVAGWVTTTLPVAHPMFPADGSFNSKTEGVTAQVDTTGWAAGQHLIFVRGQDASGTWGPYSAVFLTITGGITPTPTSTVTPTPTATLTPTITPSPTVTPTFNPEYDVYLPGIYNNPARSAAKSAASTPTP
jgi:hypothetical protein